MFQSLADFLDSFLEMGIPWYDITVHQHGRQIWRHSNGFLDPERTVPVAGNERCNMYSCSKPITCAAALQLWEKGAFQLDDALGRYLPEYENMTVRTPDGSIVPAENKITIRHLFSMTAGFSYDMSVPSLLRCAKETGGVCPTREMIRALASEPLQFEPGTDWSYSLCHDVLAAFVEVVSGEMFNDYLEKHIFRPLGMKRTTFLLPDSEVDTLAPQYWSGKDGIREGTKRRDPYVPGPGYASGGAGCVSTLEDYILFADALLRDGAVLKKDTIRMMCEPQMPEIGLRNFWIPGYTYGLGVRTPLPDSPATDFGWGGAAGALLVVDPVRDVSAFYLQHVRESPNATMRTRIPEFLRDIPRG